MPSRLTSAAALAALPDAQPRASAAERGLRVRLCVLLAGGVRPSPLAVAAGRSVLDLHASETRTVLGLWLDALAAAGVSQVRLVHAAQATAPAGPLPDGVRAVPDAQPFRGPAGALRDACEGSDPDEPVLVVEGATAMPPSLAGLAGFAADITVAVNPDGSPAGIYLLRARMLGFIPGRGYMDLKEQWLGKAIAAGAHVRAWPLPCALVGLRTRADLLRAALAADLSAAEGPAHANRSILAQGAEVDETAAALGSILMPGSRVGRGAVVARSVLCPGAEVPAGAEVVDSVVSRQGVVPDRRVRLLARRTWLGGAS